MKIRKRYLVFIILTVLVALMASQSGAAVFVQCPGDADGDAVIDAPDPSHPNAACMHIAGGDGFVTMADGRVLYIFGFSDVTGITPDQVLSTAELRAESPSPLIKVREGQEFYLTLTTLPMKIRPDLFDPHTVHWHGFPNAATVFDGEPMASIAANPNASLTYYYRVPEPGTYMYHCHVEATEHMQMGMLGNLYVTPLQDGQSIEYPPGSGRFFSTFAYNDEDGSTGYDIEYPVQIIGFDPDFHDANENVQPLPFAAMKDTYMMINGRGYPDTVNPSELGGSPQNNFYASQKTHSIITAAQGDRVLLRFSSLNTVNISTITVLGIPMLVVGKDAKLLRGADPDGAGPLLGPNLYYLTSSVTLGGGQSADVILDTSLVEPGTYVMYTTNLNELSNNGEDFGGMMTEVIINP